MPSLVRFLIALAFVAAAAFGIVYALANFVTPKPRPMEQIVPPSRLNR